MLVASSCYIVGCGDSTEPLLPGSLEVVAGNGQSAVAGTAVPIPPSVRLLTTRGIPLAGAQVTFTSNEDSLVTVTERVTDAQGVAALSSWTLPKRAGSHHLTVSSAGVTPLVIQATATAGAPAALRRASPDAQAGTVGSETAAPPAVLVVDANENPIAGVTVLFEASTGGSVGSGPAVSDAAGIARSGGWTLGPLAGEQTLSARVAGGLIEPVVFVAHAAAHVASRLAVIMQPGAAAESGALLAVQPVVEIQDVFGNRVLNAVLPVTAGLAAGEQVLSGTLTVLSTEGRASFTDLAVSGSGTAQLRFTTGGLADATSASFNVGGETICDGAVRTLGFALGESQRFLTSAQQAPFCFDFAMGANAGEQYLVQIENMSMTGDYETGLFSGAAIEEDMGIGIRVRTGAPAPAAGMTTARRQIPDRAVHSWDFGGGEVFEIRPAEPAGGARPALIKRGNLLLDGSAGSSEVMVGDTILAELVGIPRLGIANGVQRAVVRYTTAELIIAEDIRLAELTREGGGTNTPLSVPDMQAIAADYARYAKVQSDRFFGDRHNAAIDASGGRPIAIHSLMYADNIWGYTFPHANYFVWDFWVGTNGAVKGPNQQIERNSNNLFMHEISHMRHAGLNERANKPWRGHRWLVEGFARATERWPIAMRLLGTATPSRTNNVVLPSYPEVTLNMLEDVPVYTQASFSMYSGYAASSYVFDYFADQVARTTGTDWTAALAEFVLNAGTEDGLHQVINRYFPGLDVGTLFTRARIALYTDDYAAGLPDWTQYHQFRLRASRATLHPELDPHNLWLKIRPGESFTDTRTVLPGSAFGYIIDGTSASASARVLFELPRADHGVISVTRIQ